MVSKVMQEIEVCRLREALEYNRDTGLFTWRNRPRSHFKRDKDHSTWNKRFAGKRAFTTSTGTGYLQTPIFGRLQLAHRVAFAIHHGYWPHKTDHINGVRDDNRISNLREVTNQQNGQNSAMSLRNTSGRVGVSWRKDKQLWGASIRVDGKTHHLGKFKVFSDAVAAREAGEKRFGFHPNHGRMDAAKELANG